MTASSATAGSYPQPISVVGKSFALNGKTTSYRFHVDEESGDLISDHFGGLVTENPPVSSRGSAVSNGSFATNGHLRREIPDLGRGDFRTLSLLIKHEEGFTVSDFKYESHTVSKGKPVSAQLPGTFGDEEQVMTLVVRMVDAYYDLAADVSYSVFPEHDAIVRSVTIVNQSEKSVVVEKLSSLSVDLPFADYDMVGLRGEATRERTQFRRKVDYGTQGFGSTTGYSSHFYNPFLSILSSTATETHGEAWGFSLVYSGSFTAEVEKSPRGLVRASIGMNNLQLSWSLKPGESLSSPECVAIFSDAGLGGMSRKFHRLYRRHLIKSKFVDEPRPTLLNSWEGLYFNFDENSIERLARSSADLGVKLFVLDDGWFGVKYPRLKDTAGLGDWVPNPDRFPNGLKSIVDKVTKMEVSRGDSKLQFGLWIEPEMVNAKSELYEHHPDWVMSAGSYARSEARNQLVLNLGLPEVQEYIIQSISALLQDKDTPISYVKWDNNRAIREGPSPQSYHGYMLGMYRVFHDLTSRFPDILWEGCAGGGGRFDPGVLQYFPQIWTSDNMDPIDRIKIQFGTSLVYPTSTMGAHVGAVPSHVTKRTQSLQFRAHVAMMGGSFGLELDPDTLSSEDREQIPGLLALAEKINPVVIRGDLWRLRLPENSDDPAALIISQDGTRAVLFVFHLMSTVLHEVPFLRLQGLEPSARYKLDGGAVLSGATLMNGGIQFPFREDYDSRVIWIERI